MKICSFAFVLIIKASLSGVLYCPFYRKNTTVQGHITNLFMVIKVMRRLKIKMCFPFFSVLYMLYFIYIFLSIFLWKSFCVFILYREKLRQDELNGIWASDESGKLLRLKTRAQSLLSMLDHRASKYILEKSIFCV